MRVRRLGKALAATIALVVLLIGVPYGLCRYVGWPLPRQVPSWHAIVHALGSRDITDQVIVDVLAVALWCVWSVLVCAFVAETVALRRRRAVGRLPVAGRLQPLAGALLGMVVLGFAALVARPSATGAGLPRAAIVQPVRPPATSDGRPFGIIDAELTAAITRGAVGNGTHASVPSVGERTYTVRDDDTLWGIAETQLGDAARWEAIYALNRGVPQPGGGALENPHWIYPGWVLRLPAEETTSAAPARTSAPSTPSIPTSRTPTSEGHAAMPAGPTGPVHRNAPVASSATTAPARTEPASATNGHDGGALGPSGDRTGATAPVSSDHPSSGDRTAPSERPVGLSSGGRVGGALVLAVLGALVALRLRRRQRYRPRPVRPGRDLGAPALTPALRDLLVSRRAHEGGAVPSEESPLSVVPEVAERATPDRIEVGTRAGDTVELVLGEWPGLVLAGPGAEPTLRAFCAALLARSGPYNVEVVTTRSLSQRLFAGLDVTATVCEMRDEESVVARVEANLVANARQLDGTDYPDAAAYRADNPGDPYPLVVALLDGVPLALAGRWRALCASATRYGGAALVLGSSDAGAGDTTTEDTLNPRIVVGNDGQVEEASPASLAAVLSSVRFFRLGLDESDDVLAPIVAVHNYDGTVYEGPDDEPAPEDGTDEAWAPVDLAEEPTTDDLDPATEPTIAPPVDASPALVSSTSAAEPPRASTNPSWHDAAWPEPRAVTAVDGAPPVVVQLLGPARIEAFGVVVKSRLRRSAYELLAWFALRPEGATLDTAADALWPEAGRERARQHFWNALGNLRTRAGKRTDTDSDALELIVKVGEHYVPDAAVLDVDLWRFEGALREAAQASDDTVRVDALESALLAYGGDFCPGVDYLWSEPARADLHHRALDAAFALAELHEQAGRAEAAIATWERALGVDPICEAAARRLAEWLDRSGRLDDAIEVGARFRRNLALVELEPSEGADAFFGNLRRRQRDIARVEARRRNARRGDEDRSVGDDRTSPGDLGR